MQKTMIDDGGGFFICCDDDDDTPDEMSREEKAHYQDCINKALAMFNRTIVTSMPVRLLADEHYWPVRNMIKDAGLFIHAESAWILCVSKAAV